MVLVDEEICTGCGLCVVDCFPKRIEVKDNKAKSKGPCMECGHCIAVCPQNAVSIEGLNMDDVVELKDVDISISGDSYLNFLKSRRTIRQFSDNQVPKESLEKILEVGRFSPTGGNQQNVRYYVINKNAKKVKEMVLDTLNSIKGTPYSNMWGRLYKAYHEHGSDGIFFNSESVILVISSSNDNAMISAAHMETMVYAQNLGMLYSGFFITAAKYSKELQEYLELKDGEEVKACMVIGEPKVKYKRTVPRKDLEVTWN